MKFSHLVLPSLALTLIGPCYANRGSLSLDPCMNQTSSMSQTGILFITFSIDDQMITNQAVTFSAEDGKLGIAEAGYVLTFEILGQDKNNVEISTSVEDADGVIVAKSVIRTEWGKFAEILVEEKDDTYNSSIHLVLAPYKLCQQ